MITVTPEMYSDVASGLLDELRKGAGFYNGKIDTDTEQYYSTLTCSLIVCHAGCTSVEAPYQQIEKVIPVWWDFSICADGITEPNDFSWTEFSSYIACHG